MEKKNSSRVLWRNLKAPPVMLIPMWESNIKINLNEYFVECLLIYLAQCRKKFETTEEILPSRKYLCSMEAILTSLSLATMDRTSTEKFWNYMDMRKPNYSDINLFQCQIVHLKIHLHWPRFDVRASTLRCLWLTASDMHSQNKLLRLSLFLVLNYGKTLTSYNLKDYI
jgi:hypothetical protein